MCTQVLQASLPGGALQGTASSVRDCYSPEDFAALAASAAAALHALGQPEHSTQLERLAARDVAARRRSVQDWPARSSQAGGADPSLSAPDIGRRLQQAFPFAAYTMPPPDAVLSPLQPFPPQLRIPIVVHWLLFL